MKPVHQQVKEALLRRFERMPLETRLPADRDLAREFNVAFLTINRVMNDLMRDGYVVRRPRRGTFLASHARRVAAETSGEGSLVLAYPNVFSNHIYQHIRLAEELALKHRLRLLEYKLTPNSGPEHLAGYAAGTADLRGVILLPVPTPQGREMVRRLDGLGVPVVVVSDIYDPDGSANLRCVDADWGAIGRLAATALLEAGHRRLAWLNHEAGQPGDLARGMRAALQAHGLRGSDLLTIGQGTSAWTDSRESGYRLAQRLLDEDLATGVYCTSIAGVRGTLRALYERGLAAPAHLSLVATGTQNGEEDYVTPPLTTVDADWAGEMRFAFAAVLGEAGGERQLRLPPRLSLRGSIAAPRTATPS